MPVEPIRFPQIGDPVHYRSYGSADGEHVPACRPAIVIEILDPDIKQLQLFVMTPTGAYWNVCYHNEEYAGPGAGGTWHWPGLSHH